MSRPIQAARLGHFFQVFRNVNGVQIITSEGQNGAAVFNFTVDGTRELIAALQEALLSTDIKATQHTGTCIEDMLERISKVEEHAQTLPARLEASLTDLYQRIAILEAKP